MRFVLFLFFFCLADSLFSLEMSMMEDGLYAQTDVLLDRDLIYGNVGFFPECIETEKTGLECLRWENHNTYVKANRSLFDDGLDWPRQMNDSEVSGLSKQMDVLKRIRTGNELVGRKDLLFVVKCLLKRESICKGDNFKDNLRVHRLNGADGRGNVQFTGYFTPQISASRQKSKAFPYPIFKRPPSWLKENGPHATREEIDKGGVLNGKGLEIAWTNRPLAIFAMQMQGSGIIKFEDGTESLLAYDGKNGHEYVSIGSLLVEDGHIEPHALTFDDIETFFKENPLHIEKYLYKNPSYVFFKPKKGRPKGAAGVELIAGHSIAVDPKVIPLGSVLVGKVPVLDESFRLVGHEWKLLFAQDTGGGIDGPSHVDLYMGAAKEAKQIARHMKHDGEIWLLLRRQRSSG